MNSPLEELLNFAHRSYIRLETEQLLTECLDLEDLRPFHHMLEGLVLAGISSLMLLRDVLDEIVSAKTSLAEKELGVRQDLVDALSELGLRMPQLLHMDGSEGFKQICHNEGPFCLRSVHEGLDSEDEVLIQEICAEAGERVIHIARRRKLLMVLEEAVRDWIGSLAYESVRIDGENSLLSPYVH
jgi:hypothetical protein